MHCRVKYFYKSKNYSSLNIVIGNESCDLDSAMSSIVYGAFLNWLDREQKKDRLNISMLDVDRRDLPLKTEVAFCLKESEISEDSLVFRDDIDLKQLLTSGHTEITLIDHHVLSKKLNFLTPHVSEIIDHRPLNEKQWNYSVNVRSLIEIVGSCATLVGQRIREEGDAGKEFLGTLPMCADLLHSVIILDTVNFSKQVNKATPLDEEIVKHLEDVLKFENCEAVRAKKLDRLLKARCDVSSLTPSQLLRKDLKVLEDLFVPSFPVLVKEFLSKPQALESVSEALKSRHCNIAVLLGMDLTEGLKRDAAVVSPSCPERGEKLAKFLQDWSTPPLQLVSEASDCLYYKQMNLSASRKQYMPALNEFIVMCK